MILKFLRDPSKDVYLLHIATPWAATSLIVPQYWVNYREKQDLVVNFGGYTNMKIPDWSLEKDPLSWATCKTTLWSTGEVVRVL